MKMSALPRLTGDTQSDTIQDIMWYEDAQYFIMFQLAPDCNQMTLKLQQLAYAIAKAHSILNAMKAKIRTSEQLIFMNQATPNAMPPRSPQPPIDHLDCHRSMDHSQERYGNCVPSAN
uniref:Uncharacterized protein n=1 Tax=Romanomermis culicivorax TaxID=13658 RepID=A0A915HUR4_ROMCU